MYHANTFTQHIFQKTYVSSQCLLDVAGDPGFHQPPRQIAVAHEVICYICFEKRGPIDIWKSWNDPSLRLPFQRSLFQEIEGFKQLQPPLKPHGWTSSLRGGTCIIQVFGMGKGPCHRNNWQLGRFLLAKLAVTVMFAISDQCLNFTKGVVRNMFSIIQQRSTSYRCLWDGSIPRFLAFFSYGQSKTMHIEYNVLQSIFISICISVYLCCLYFHIYL